MSYQWHIYIDWDGDGSAPSTGFDEAINCIDLEIDRGWNDIYDVSGSGEFLSAFSPPKVGTARMVFDNTSTRYSPWGASSDGSLGFDVGPGRRVEIYGGESSDTASAMFTGFTKTINENPHDKTVSVYCVDGVEWLQNNNAYVAFDTNTPPSVRTQDTITAAITSNCGYPFGDNLSITGNTIPYYQCNKKALTALVELTNSVVGLLGVFADGSLNYIGLSTLNSSDYHSYSSSDFLKDISISQPYDHLVTSITVNQKTVFPDSTTDSFLWRQGFNKAYITAGSTDTYYAGYTFNNQPTLAVPNTLVSGTNFVANTAYDGTGTDGTSDISIVVTDYGTRAKLDITNAGSTDYYLRTLNIQGQAYPETIKTEYGTGTDPQNVGNRELRLDVLPIWKATNAQPAYGPRYQSFQQCGYPQTTKKVTVQIDTNKIQFARELGDFITLNITTPDLTYSTWNTSYDYNVFWLSRIRHKWQSENGQSLLTTWDLTHQFVVGASTVF